MASGAPMVWSSAGSRFARPGSRAGSTGDGAEVGSVAAAGAGRATPSSGGTRASVERAVASARRIAIGEAGRTPLAGTFELVAVGSAAQLMTSRQAPIHWPRTLGNRSQIRIAPSYACALRRTMNFEGLDLASRTQSTLPALILR